ncbi:MAG: hypothetical protein U9R27_00350, partial [Campylobacterota bacterium]|nr:hypothetical protein [Campylobacterota bacterium]
MKSLINIVISLSALFFWSGCGSSGSSSDTTGFTYAMVEDQPFYTFDERDARWIRVVFDSSGQVVYEILEGDEIGGTYSIEDRKIVVYDNDKDPVIALDTVKPTLWEVTRADNDGRVWQDTWHLEQQFSAEMIVGKRFLSEYILNGTDTKEELLFTETTLKIYDMDGTLREELPYILENGVLKITNAGGTFSLFLMFADEDGKLNLWYSNEGESGYSTWT